jgi:argininosuccinate lyase
MYYNSSESNDEHKYNTGSRDPVYDEDEDDEEEDEFDDALYEAELKELRTHVEKLYKFHKVNNSNVDRILRILENLKSGEGGIVVCAKTNKMVLATLAAIIGYIAMDLVIKVLL